MINTTTKTEGDSSSEEDSARCTSSEDCFQKSRLSKEQIVEKTVEGKNAAELTTVPKSLFPCLAGGDGVHQSLCLRYQALKTCFSGVFQNQSTCPLQWVCEAKQWYLTKPAAAVNFRHYLAFVTLFNCLLLYFAWGWNLVFLLFFSTCFQVGIPAALKLKTPLPDYRRFGKWAVVTGAAEEMGKAYALTLAKTGMNIALLGENGDREKLNELQDQMRGLGVDVRSIFMDDIHEDYKQELEHLEIGLLVNLTGTEGTSCLSDFSANDSSQMSTNNVDMLVTMTHQILPQMTRRKKGLIINVAPLCSQGSSSAILSGIKGFIQNFTDCMAKENASQGVQYHLIDPGDMVSDADFMAEVSSHLKLAASLPYGSSSTWKQDAWNSTSNLVQSWFPLLGHFMTSQSTQPSTLPSPRRRSH